MPQLIALLRGINVGRAKRIAMADLCALITGLGYANVRTLLNSGNVIFEGPSSKTGDQALRIQNAIAAKLGVSARVSVVTAADLAAIVRENPLQSIANDPSRFLAAFVSDRAVLTKIKPLIHQSWAPDQLAIGSRAAYIWCANGIVESKLLQAFSRQMGEAITDPKLVYRPQVECSDIHFKCCAANSETDVTSFWRWSPEPRQSYSLG